MILWRSIRRTWFVLLWSSLSKIIPMSPDEVVRKGSGTLCEMLLMVQAFKSNIICPNKHKSELDKIHNGHLLESETYIGGHVECLESGVFRSDLPTRFHLVPDASRTTHNQCQCLCLAKDRLIDNLDRDLKYAIGEGKVDIGLVTNYDDVKEQVKRKLEGLRDAPIGEELPLIYHLDVAAMYLNIILTNQFQHAISIVQKRHAFVKWSGYGEGRCILQREVNIYI